MQSLNDLGLSKENKSDKIFNIVFSIILVLAITIFAITMFVTIFFTNIEVSGVSMESTLHDGDVLLAKKDNKEVNRLDIIVIEGEKEGTLLIKRAIALGGDTVKIEDGYVYLKKSGEVEFTKLEESYVKDYGKTYYKGKLTTFQLTIPEGEIFYLGDNRLNSADSRVYGTCTEDQIFAVIEDWSLNFRSLNKFIIGLFV